MLITVLLPSGSTASLDVGENTLVFDGSKYAEPLHLKYVELYALPVSAQSMPYKEVPAQTLSTAVRIRALVTALDLTEEPDTDPSLMAAPDPSGGQCICGLTCNGTELRFVVVQLEN